MHWTEFFICIWHPCRTIILVKRKIHLDYLDGKEHKSFLFNKKQIWRWSITEFFLGHLSWIYFQAASHLANSADTACLRFYCSYKRYPIDVAIKVMCLHMIWSREEQVIVFLIELILICISLNCMNYVFNSLYYLCLLLSFSGWQVARCCP